MKPKAPPAPATILPQAIALGLCLNAPLYAVDFRLGEIEGQLDSNLSVGASWALRNPDPDLLKSHSNDDGQLNFEQGKTFTKIFKGVHDLELKYGDTGVFVRGKYWYDFELKDEHREFKDIDDHNRKESAQSSGAELLDAFIYHNYSFDDYQGVVRLGKQVVSWGESTFILGGINSINPVDVSAFRRPGAEIKEGLIPVNMFYVSQNLSENLEAELFYQLEWDQTVIDNCGTFFSNVDFIADGCGGLPVGPVLNQDPVAQAALAPEGINLTSEGIEIARAGDNDPRDSGQWGTAFRWFAPELDSEFGAYFVNYHSRTPYSSAISSPHMADLDFAPSVCSNIGINNPAVCNGILGTPIGMQMVQAYRLGTGKYFVDYPEDIQLYGLSASTNLDTGTTLAGELSYRPNMPLQISPVDLVAAAVGDPALSPVLSSGHGTVANNSTVSGYKRKEVTQAQVTAIHFFDNVMAADRISLIGEVGVTHIGGLEGRGGLRYGRHPNYGQGALYPDNSLCTNNSSTPQYCNDDGFATSTSWGYRARAIWEYSNLLGGLELKPNVAWSHDVDGFGPEPGFNEGSKAITFGVDASYLNTYSASLAYTNFFGGDYNMSTDRDFVALSFGVSF